MKETNKLEENGNRPTNIYLNIWDDFLNSKANQEQTPF